MVTDLNPADLLYVAARGDDEQVLGTVELVRLCRCTECGGSRYVDGDRCRHCGGSGWDPDRVQERCLTHGCGRSDSVGMRRRGIKLCSVAYMQGSEGVTCEWGWVPRIGTLP